MIKWLNGYPPDGANIEASALIGAALKATIEVLPPSVRRAVLCTRPVVERSERFCISGLKISRSSLGRSPRRVVAAPARHGIGVCT